MEHEGLVQHHCEPMDWGARQSRDAVEERYYGHAVEAIFKASETGRWYATNGKYISPVGYCPFCGERLPRQESLSGA